MILDSIKLNNFGIYSGSQESVLAPLDADKRITLFGGMNGGGKTTILDAVQLALYGPKARCAGRGKLAYREYLKAMIHRGADPAEGASVGLWFRRFVSGEMLYYRLERSWNQNSKGIEERVQVWKDSDPDPILSEHWDEYIEGYIPSGIAHLFFFDAEQIKDLADGEHASEILGTAIHTLLGLDLVDRLETDLIALERRKRTAAKTGEEAQRLKIAQEESKRMQQLLDESQGELGFLGNEVGRLGKALQEAEKRFREEGGELFLLQNDLIAERQRIQSELSLCEAELRELAAGPAPFLLITGLLTEVGRTASREHEVRSFQNLNRTLEERDLLILQNLKTRKLPAQHLRVITDLLKNDRKQRSEASKEPLVLNAPEGFPASIRHIQTSLLPAVRKDTTEKLEIAAALQERLTRLDMELARVPDQDAIAKVHRELQKARSDHQEAQARQAAQEDKVRVLSRQLQEAEAKYKRELGEDVQCRVEREHGVRLLKHSAKVRDTIGKFRIAVIQNHTERLERLVLECFTRLLRKTNLVTGLRIDPSTFRIDLSGADGKHLPFDRLSAGERQLLATALLWGLGKASGRPLPTIIDTPLGRLDSSHRRHLVERYFPAASHQVILLSTDEEIDQESLSRLKPAIGRSYTLDFEETKRSTFIKKGYFWNHETAC